MSSLLMRMRNVLTLGGKEEDTWQHEWQPLCLSVSLSLRLSLFVSFPFTNLFLTLSLSRFTEV